MIWVLVLKIKKKKKNVNRDLENYEGLNETNVIWCKIKAKRVDSAKSAILNASIL